AGRLPSNVKYLSLHGLSELSGIEVSDDAVTFGAMTTYRDVRANPVVQAELPMLVQAAKETGAIAIQSRGTLGGNIVNASPAADTPPALLAYGASIELRSASGARWVDYAAFHQGYKVMDRRPDELLTRVRVPRVPYARVHVYEKVGTRSYQAISKVCLAGVGRVVDGRVADVRIGLGAVAPTVLLARATMAALNGQAADPALGAKAFAAMGQDVKPIDDIRSTADYRGRVAQNLAADFARRVVAGS
ncbi:MAG: FAD binding domain-containing protein, partial [Myxococcota bacterium]